MRYRLSLQRNLSHITYKRCAFIKSKDRAAFRSRHLWPQSETDSFRIQPSIWTFSERFVPESIVSNMCFALNGKVWICISISICQQNEASNVVTISCVYLHKTRLALFAPEISKLLRPCSANRYRNESGYWYRFAMIKFTLAQGV